MIYTIVVGWFLTGILISTIVTWLDYYNGVDLRLWKLGYILFGICLGPIALIIVLSMIISIYWPIIDWDVVLIKGRKQE